MPTAEFERLAQEKADTQLRQMTMEQTRERLAAMTRVELTPELLQSIEEIIAEGNYPETAAKVLAIPMATFRAWVERGGEMVERGTYSSETDPLGLQAELYLRVTQHEAHFERNSLHSLMTRIADDKDYRGAAWLLERRFPQHWSKRDVGVGRDDRVEKHIVARMKAKAVDIGADKTP